MAATGAMPVAEMPDAKRVRRATPTTPTATGLDMSWNTPVRAVGPAEVHESWPDCAETAYALQRGCSLPLLQAASDVARAAARRPLQTMRHLDCCMLAQRLCNSPVGQQGAMLLTGFFQRAGQNSNDPQMQTRDPNALQMDPQALATKMSSNGCSPCAPGSARPPLHTGAWFSEVL
eukprot:m.306906 g.306906  ORF g.306906 m.306906 type:complete len:176 (-) comp19506_c0_seq1:1663-2190(-)